MAQAAFVTHTTQSAPATDVRMPPWREVIYTQEEAQSGDAAEDALAQLLQQLATANAVQPISAADAVPAEVLSASEVTLTPLAVAFTNVQAHRPGATPLDILMDAYDELTTCVPAAIPSDVIASA